MLQKNVVPQSTIVRLKDTHRAKVRAAINNKKFDLILRAAQTLFVQDIWVDGSSIARELGMSRDHFTTWTAYEGSQASFIICRYQLWQRSLGLKDCRGSSRATKS